MGVGRLFFSGLTHTTFLINLNFIVLTIVLFFITLKIELNRQNISKFFWACLIEMTIVLSIGLCLSGQHIIYIAWAIRTVRM